MADCVFHTGRPAVIHCKQCGKPLCSQCRLVTETGIFCGDRCAQAGEVFAKKVRELDTCESSAVRTWPGKLVRLIVFLIVLYVVYRLVRHYLPEGALGNIQSRLKK